MVEADGDRAAGGEAETEGPGPTVGTLNARDAAEATLTGPAVAASLAGDEFEAVGCVVEGCVVECGVEGVFDE